MCMIATIPLVTGNKLDCFISARGMLTIVWHCVLLFCCCFIFCVFFVDFYMLINHLLKKRNITVNQHRKQGPVIYPVESLTSI